MSKGQFLARVPNNLGWAAFLPAGIAGRVVDMFSYGANFLPVPASGSLQVDIQIQNDSDFVVVGGVAVVTEVDNTTFLAYPAWPFTVEISDSGSGRSLQNIAQPLANLFGTAEQIVPWLQPKFVKAGSTFTTRINNLAATARNVRLSFIGAKVFGF